ncbi:hypothetical protein O181_040309 [Austropuccinia psidii MF-1]|uniref:Uncharacterized protein n=1 Tax=Austropuccinia psidii MF-1 TaxID=1389203 RepID=A0A9Q3DC60_9BASI|nr:hypothetical protein [Austropuccinia psidii MF-1]
MTEKYKKEAKEAGRNSRDDAKKLIQKCRTRLCTRRYKFALANNYAKCYLKVLADVKSHSNDEYNPDFKLYAIKTLPYQSQSANNFIWNLDLRIRQHDKMTQKESQKGRRCQPKVPMITKLEETPKNPPIDFFDLKWFNKLPDSQKVSVADSQKVAFVPAEQNKESKAIHPNERLSDRAFNDKYWESLTSVYDLSHELSQSSDDDETEESDDEQSLEIKSSSGEEEEDESDQNENNHDKEVDIVIKREDDEIANDFEMENHQNHQLNNVFIEECGTDVRL